ncbi:MAG: 4Fe-4S binding protein [Kiritimatiellae bacterium]|nr:4Fe-4S binding protein [Kiritimatiellia bacterium]
MAAVVDKEKCAGCGTCEGDCPVQAIQMVDGKAEVNADLCVECGACTASCPCEAISLG